MKSSLKILMLDDNRDDIFLARKILERAKLQFELTIATDKQEFSDALDKDAYDIILSDHKLEQFNCLEALKICRDKGLKIPVILVSGMVTEETAGKLKDDGIVDYLLKTDIRQLPEVVKKWAN